MVLSAHVLFGMCALCGLIGPVLPLCGGDDGGHAVAKGATAGAGAVVLSQDYVALPVSEEGLMVHASWLACLLRLTKRPVLKP